MLTAIFSFIIVLSVITAFLTNNTAPLTETVLNEPVNAVELCIYLCGGMCFWGGLMRVAEKSGLTGKLADIFAVLLGGLFPGLDKKGKAFRAVCMNITANLLGLGNAATPFGIEAMKAMKEEEKAADEATPSMIIFTVINTASLTLIPSTVLSLRMKYGSESPMDIMPAVWITSAAALAAALTAAAVPLIFKEKSHDRRQSADTRNNACDNTSRDI